MEPSSAREAAIGGAGDAHGACRSRGVAMGRAHAPGDFDVAIIGGGVVGCAMARRLAFHAGLGARVALLEARDSLAASPASAGNSGVVHCGFDAAPATLEARLVRRGAALWRRLQDAQAADWRAFSIPERRCGALVVAWNAMEARALPGIVRRARANACGPAVVSDVLPRSALTTLEPSLPAEVISGVAIRDESVADSAVAALYYAAQAVRAGAVVRTGFRVEGLTRSSDGGGGWLLRSASGDEVRARVVINCAGLHGDEVEAAAFGRASFEIRPRRGQFVVVAPPRREGAVSSADTAGPQRIILPVPSKRTKGVLMAPSVYGPLLVGPTAEDQEDRETAAVVPETTSMLLRRAQNTCRHLTGDEPVLAEYAGLRPASDSNGYRIQVRPKDCWVTVGGIRSTGFTACLAIAEHVTEMVGATMADALPHLDVARTVGDMGRGGGPIAEEPPLLAARDVDESDPAVLRVRVGKDEWLSLRIAHPLSLAGRELRAKTNAENSKL